MLIAIAGSRAAEPAICAGANPGDVVETRLWIEEHDWLYALLHCGDNVAPTFRIPDLISGCVALVFARGDAVERVFGFLGTTLVMRAAATARRREAMWRAQYELLHGLQCSPANRHPHPKFQLDQLTTACVALCRQADASGAAVLQQARRNMAERHARAQDARSQRLAR